jgi:biotin synthase
MSFNDLTLNDIESWLREEDPARLELLWAAADAARRAHVGEAVHLRGLIEVSSYCCRLCGYCGLRADNRGLERYRMTRDEILNCAREAREFGYGTVVMQAGEDYGLTQQFITDIIHAIKEETGLAVTLSLGERPDEDFIAWRAAGADRYLLRFETSDPRLYAMIHPPGPGRTISDRLAMLERLRGFGYEIGSGVMVGIPGQSYAMLARDLDTFRNLDLDMIGVGPYISHPATPLGKECGTAAPGDAPVAPALVAGVSPAGMSALQAGDQVPNSELMTYKTVALTRLVRPDANIPSTTALATLNLAQGRELGLQRGANIVMPNLTPPEYRKLYEIYPAKACIAETGRECHTCMGARIRKIGREVGRGPGGRKK